MEEGYFKASPLIPKRTKILHNNMHYLSNNIFGLPDYEDVKKVTKNNGLQLSKVLFQPGKITTDKEAPKNIEFFPSIGNSKRINRGRNMSESDLISKSVILKNENDMNINKIKRLDHNIMNTESHNHPRRTNYRIDSLKPVSEHGFHLGRKASFHDKEVKTEIPVIENREEHYDVLKRSNFELLNKDLQVARPRSVVSENRSQVCIDRSVSTVR
jgi:hypothetical protein